MSLKSFEFLNIWMARWDQFWFAPKSPYILSLFRVGLCGTLFAMYLERFLDIKLFYFNNGLIDAKAAKLFFRPFNEPLFYLFPSSDFLIYLFHILFLAGLLLITLGLSNRIFIFSTFLLHLCFIQRNHFIVYGADLYATFWLFFLCFMKTGSYFNIFTYLKKRPNSQETTLHNTDELTSVGVRLMQIQICISYGITGLEKLKGFHWWEGSAVWYVIGNQQLVPTDLSFFYNIPLVVSLMTFSVLVFEIYFPIAIWQNKLRPLWVLFGITFHLLTAFFMGILYFGLVMIVSYLMWIRKEDIPKILTLKQAPDSLTLS